MYDTLKALYSSFLHTIGARLELHSYLFGTDTPDLDEEGEETDDEDEEPLVL